MGQHTAPRDQPRNPEPTPGYVGRHRLTAGSDLPPRGEGVTVDNTRPPAAPAK